MDIVYGLALWWPSRVTLLDSVIGINRMHVCGLFMILSEQSEDSRYINRMQICGLLMIPSEDSR
jgi:hypothetical protein